MPLLIALILQAATSNDEVKLVSFPGICIVIVICIVTSLVIYSGFGYWHGRGPHT